MYNGLAPSKRGCGVQFGPDVTADFCSRNGLSECGDCLRMVLFVWLCPLYCVGFPLLWVCLVLIVYPHYYVGYPKYYMGYPQVVYRFPKYCTDICPSKLRKCIVREVTCLAGTRSVPNSEVLYTDLCSWDSRQCPL